MKKCNGKKKTLIKIDSTTRMAWLLIEELERLILNALIFIPVIFNEIKLYSQEEGRIQLPQNFMLKRKQ